MPRVTLFPATVEMYGAVESPISARVQLVPTDPPFGMVADVTINNLIHGSAQPGTGVAGILGAAGQQFPLWRVEVGGVDITRHLTGSRSVTRSRDGMATWAFALPVHSETQDSRGGPLAPPPGGRPFSAKGPGFGRSAVNIWGGYVTAGGVVWVPLVTNGVVSGQGRGTKPDLDTMSGGDAELRYGRVKVSLSRSPGHGTASGSVCRQMALAAGVPDSMIALESGGWRYKEIAARTVDAYDWCRDYLQPENRLLYHDGSGQLINPVRVGCDSTAQVVATFGIFDIIAGSTRPTFRQDVLTTLCLKGFEQVLRVDDAESCAQVTTEQVIETFGNYAPRQCYRVQQTDGSVADLPVVPNIVAYILVERVTIRRTYECGTLVSERTLTEAWYNPAAARYRLVADSATHDEGDPSTWHDDYLLTYMYDSTAVADDDTPAYLWEVERFVPVTLVKRDRTYTERVTDDRTEDYLTRIVERSGGWFVPRRRIKARPSPGDTWESTDFDGLTYIMGDGSGVNDTSERFYMGGGEAGLVQPNSSLDLRVATTDLVVSDLGYITAESQITTGWDHRDGTGHLYSDGTLSQDETDMLLEVGRVETKYPTGDDDVTGGRKLTTTYKLGKRVGGTDEPLDSYGPPAERKNRIHPETTQYGAGDAKNPKSASRYEQRQINAIVTVPSLLTNHFPSTDTQDSAWAENVTQLKAQGGRIIREGAAAELTFAVPVNWTLDPNALVHVTVPDIELDNDVEVVTLTHADNGAVPPQVTTQVSGLVVWA